MRRCLNILSILILLTLGVELCSARGVGLGSGASPLACIVDDDADSELEVETLRECAPDEPGFWNATCLQGLAHSRGGELRLSFEDTAIEKACPRVRRHRWLCKECC